MTQPITTTTTTELTEGRWDTIRREVAEYLATAGWLGEGFDAEGMVDAVAARANSINDITEDEFNAILLANDRDADEF
jgi:hypothetical protein